METQIIENHKFHESIIIPQVSDTDYAGGVYHGKYFALYNQARDQFLSEIRVSYLWLMKQGFNLSVVQLQSVYLKPISYGEKVIVNTRVSWYRTKSLGFIQQMMAKDENSDAMIIKNKVELNLVCTNSGGQAVLLPNRLIEAITTYYNHNQ
ncbi:MAG: acyl-CoA thioesterase [Desulfobacteraceae bacterium]|nr:acyl-CoA thioesterase [Desulfobacteraceae bacterium]